MKAGIDIMVTQRCKVCLRYRGTPTDKGPLKWKSETGRLCVSCRNVICKIAPGDNVADVCERLHGQLWLVKGSDPPDTNVDKFNKFWVKLMEYEGEIAARRTGWSPVEVASKHRQNLDGSWGLQTHDSLQTSSVETSLMLGNIWPPALLAKWYGVKPPDNVALMEYRIAAERWVLGYLLDPFLHPPRELGTYKLKFRFFFGTRAI